MKHFTFFLFLIFLGLNMNTSVYSQTQTSNNQQDTINPKKIKLTGSVNVNQVLYYSEGMQNARRSPYNWLLSGNFGVQAYGWTLPLSFSFSNQASQYEQSYTQPFNRIGLTPYNDWLKLHIGNSTMNLSQYTFNSQFLGTGVEAKTPFKMNIAAVYGRLQRSVELDTSDLNKIPIYKRMGFGLKLGYGDNQNFVNLIIMSAKDDKNSIALPDTSEIRPAQNLVWSLNGGFNIAKKLVVKADFATSAVNRDMLDGSHLATGKGVFEYSDFIFRPRESTTYNNAMKGSIAYTGKKFLVGMTYERIDPNYMSLGVPYFTNDVENITVNFSTQLFDGKIQLGADLGLEQDNLDGKKISTSKRNVVNLNLTFAPSPKLNLALIYSNFTSFALMRSNFEQINQTGIDENLDTLDYAQINENLNFTANYIIGDLSNTQMQQNVNLNVAYQKASDKQGNHSTKVGSKNLNTNILYTLNFMPIGLTVSTAFNNNYYDQKGSETMTLGPTLTLVKSFLKKTLRSSLAFSWNQTKTGGEVVNEIWNVKTGGSYTIKKKHKINVSIVLLSKKTGNKEMDDQKEFLELTGTFGYIFSF